VPSSRVQGDTSGDWGCGLGNCHVPGSIFVCAADQGLVSMARREGKHHRAQDGTAHLRLMLTVRVADRAALRVVLPLEGSVPKRRPHSSRI